MAAHASVALLMEEPYGEFGTFNPTGHAAVYLNHVCAQTPTELRMCRPGELGVVISRYHKVNGYDWVAIPLIPYLYSVDTAAEVPTSVTKEQVAAIRDAYRREHLLGIAPSTPDGAAPKGEWIQLVGSSYDRTIHGFMVETTREQDERFIALQNDKRNHGHFNLLFHNCADFSRVVLDTYFPHSIHRNFIADVGMTTPKQVAKSLVKYSRKHPELKMSAFDIRQVAGTVPRSQKIDGVTESVVKRKRYLIPMVVLMPEFTGGVVVAYLVDGRGSLPKEASVFQVNDPQSLVDGRAQASAAPAITTTSGQVSRSTANAKPI
ncbi:hypothetical protein [Granulicella rosea]|uniref:hypothetical protein n=1 Tax=Granulicella rosea TaxID=474952 RepID=UPI00115C61CD|nr:hypothetical protein [Granulicella rosea]